MLIIGVAKLIHLYHSVADHNGDSRNDPDSIFPTPDPSLNTSPSKELPHLVILGYSALETALTCLVLVLLLLKSKCVFHDVKRNRQRLEYADLPGRSRGAGVKRSIYAYIVVTISMLLLCITLIVVLYFYSANMLQHIYIVLLNNSSIIISLAVNDNLHIHLLTSTSRASIDHHKIALHEAVSFLKEVQEAVMTIPGMNRGSLMGGGGKDGHKLVHLTTRANLFINGLSGTEDLLCTDYISK